MDFRGGALVEIGARVFLVFCGAAALVWAVNVASLRDADRRRS